MLTAKERGHPDEVERADGAKTKDNVRANDVAACRAAVAETAAAEARPAAVQTLQDAAEAKAAAEAGKRAAIAVADAAATRRTKRSERRRGDVRAGIASVSGVRTPSSGPSASTH